MAEEHNPFLDDDTNPFDDAPAADPTPADVPHATAPAAPVPSSTSAFRDHEPDLKPPAAAAAPHASSQAHQWSTAEPAVPSTNPFLEDDTPADGAGGRPAPTGLAPGAPNWPRCRPCLRLAITEDIPPRHRMTVRIAYAGFLILVSAALANAIACIVLLARRGQDSGADSSTTGDAMGLVAGPGYVLLCAVLGWWVLKYLYLGAQRDASRQYCCFFFCGGAMLGFEALAVVGITGTYLCGAVTLVDVLADWTDEADKLVAAVTAGLWVLALLVNVLAYVRAHSAYRGKAQQGMREATDEAKAAAAQSLLTHAMVP